MSPVHAEPTPASHVRMRTPRGPVHVWTPPGYEPATADVVIYVHGYYVTVDDAWRSHRLASQFERSGQNAKFIVCGAPSAHVDPIDWPSLDDLLATIPDLPAGRVIVVAHSGGYRVVRAWLAGARVDAVVLLDAVYGPMPEVVPWLAAAADRRFVDVSELTRPWAEELHDAIPESQVVPEFPDAWTDEARAARVLHVHSKLGHHELATAGHAIPMVLGLFVR
jgi:pimeloyl-ACP methyl ester carboxylesterase